jgi:hypothetical protein
MVALQLPHAPTFKVWQFWGAAHLFISAELPQPTLNIQQEGR